MDSTVAVEHANDSRLGWFVLLTFGLLWMIMIPAALAAHGIISLRVPRGLQFAAEFSPAVAAISIAGRTGGWSNVRTLIGRVLRVKISWRWYAFVLFVPMATQLAAFAVYCAATKVTPKVDVWYDWPSVVAFYLPVCIGQEEIGWRGFFFQPQAAVAHFER